VASGALTATTDAAQALDCADVSLLCVGTPSTPHGSTDLAYLRRALDDIRAALEVARPPESGFHAVVVRSTVPPGTGDEVVAPTFADVPAGWQIGTAMCPEFLREGSLTSSTRRSSCWDRATPGCATCWPGCSPSSAASRARSTSAARRR
jgi:GDP-mannose 6-dehydrogenase